MHETPLISVIMNCYNGAEFLREAIDSVITQRYANWEIIFWDNCSTDQTQAIIQSYTDKRIRCFRGSETVPLGCARNYALEQAQGEFISFLDVDDVWESMKLSEEIKIFESNHQIGLVFSCYEIFSKNATSLSNSIKVGRYINVNDLLKNYTIGISAATVRASVIKKENIVFNTRFSLIEDYDFFLRIACYTLVYYIETVLMRCRQHGNNLSNITDKWAWEFNILIDIINTEKNKYPLLNSRLNEIKRLSMNHNIYSLIIRKRRREALKKVIANMWLFPETLRYLIPIFFGENIYAMLKNLIGSFKKL
jgi:glycosyltransferase involved in cell wall biosynthesis